jgi:hypothetical protein
LLKTNLDVIDKCTDGSTRLAIVQASTSYDSKFA